MMAFFVLLHAYEKAAKKNDMDHFIADPLLLLPAPSVKLEATGMTIGTKEGTL